MMLDKKERRLPLAFHAVLLLVLIKHSFSVYVIPELYYYFLGYLISTVLALLLIMFSYKASLHIMGIASLTTFIVSLSLYYDIRLIPFIAAGIICTGFTASSRLQLKAHEPHELVLGTLLGVVPQVGLWLIWLMPSL
jgi:hypothetical protein